MTCPIILVLRPQLTFFCFSVIVALCRTSEIGIGNWVILQVTVSRADDRSVFTFKKIEKSVIPYILLNLLIQGKLCYNLIVLKYKTFCSRLYCCYSKKIGHRPNFKMFSPTAPRFFLPRFFNLLVIAFILANCMYIYSFVKLYIFVSRICLLLLIWVSVNNTCSS